MKAALLGALIVLALIVIIKVGGALITIIGAAWTAFGA